MGVYDFSIVRIDPNLIPYTVNCEEHTVRVKVKYSVVPNFSKTMQGILTKLGGIIRT